MWIAPLSVPLLGVSSLLSVEASDAEVNHGLLLIEWLRSRGGYVSPKLTIRRSDPFDPNSRFGMFAIDSLVPREKMLEIPRSALITDEDGSDESDEDVIECGTVRNLLKEMKLGDNSNFAPYVNYLLAQPWGQIPSGWSDSGKALLVGLLENHTSQVLPPLRPMVYSNKWQETCGGASSSRFEENAALLVAQRSWDNILIPVYDMMSHRNGEYLNTESTTVHHKSKNIKVRADRGIESGEEIYTSYDMCKDCGARHDTYGTPDILRNYGFVELYPQRWIFPDVKFNVEEDTDNDDNDLTVSWIGDPPTLEGVEYLHEVSTAMALAGKTMLGSNGNIPSNELDTIRKFNTAIYKATSIALKKSITESEGCVDGICDAFVRYDDLTEDQKNIEYEVHMCDNEEFYKFHEYRDVGSVQSAYQLISTATDPITKDTCFDLDNTVQICTSYRPHYHEMVVHYTARFLPKITRVLFVGGGDSMLLHEILKYPDLEMVVGLELDQQVTRNAFRHFGSQPHWDNDKVEWWYGNACKSLLMLPKGYFGTFDMVLVDLSETVMSFKVTDELDIMAALALLLHTDGVMVKNELYFDQMKDIFPHTLQISIRDVPTICSQALVLGSNGINFMNRTLTDHKIDELNVFVRPLWRDEHMGIAHDYEFIPENLQKHCMRDKKLLDDPMSLDVQNTSPGIMMIVEAEDATFEFTSPEEHRDLIVDVLQTEGLTVIQALLPEASDSDSVVVVITREGYVTSHAHLSAKYYAFDVHFWSSFEVQPVVRDALIAAVGSEGKSSSSYRIVAGGMFGTGTWKEDGTRLGPHRTIPCDAKIFESDVDVDVNVADIILEETLKLAQGTGDVMVVCGQEGSQCTSFNALSKIVDVDRLKVIWSCPDANEFALDYADTLYECEQKILNVLKESLLPDKGGLAAIVIDPTASYGTGQVVLNILWNMDVNSGNYHDLRDVTVLLMALDVEQTLSQSSWHRNFANLVRKDIHYMEPSFKAEIHFNISDVTIDLNVAAVDRTFIKNLEDVLNSIVERTGAVALVKNLYGGQMAFIGGYEFPQWFTTDAYDKVIPFAQWSSQVPLQFQTIYQLERPSKDTSEPLSAIKIKDVFEKALSESSAPGTHQVHEISNLGDGSVMIALWTGGRAIVLWDGRDHIDVNLCSPTDNGKRKQNKFIEDFKRLIPSLSIALQDFLPRGYGKVVNFLHDTETVDVPFWAS